MEIFLTNCVLVLAIQTSTLIYHNNRICQSIQYIIFSYYVFPINLTYPGFIWEEESHRAHQMDCRKICRGLFLVNDRCWMPKLTQKPLGFIRKYNEQALREKKTEIILPLWLLLQILSGSLALASLNRLQCGLGKPN